MYVLSTLRFLLTLGDIDTQNRTTYLIIECLHMEKQVTF